MPSSPPADNFQRDYKDSKERSFMNVEMTFDLAEICGIHAGDGYMRKRGNSYELEISGGFDEKEYYDLHVVPLFEKTFNIKVVPQYFLTKKTYGFRVCKKEVCETLHSFGFPYGKKTFIVSVPEPILNSKNLDVIYCFLRGIFDTDGTLSFKRRKGSGYRQIHTKRHTLPEIKFASRSKNLRDGMCKLLIRTGFHFSFGVCKENGQDKEAYTIYLKSDYDTLLWMGNIGFKNNLKLNRFFIWMKFGFCPNGLNLEKQKKVLTGLIDPNYFYTNEISPSEKVFSEVTLRQLLRIESLGISIPKG